jgi:hypothetical protein
MTSIPVSSLGSVSASIQLLFGTLQLEIHGIDPNPGLFKYLSVQDALKARRILNGLIICYKESVDLSKLDLETVKQKVEEIGTTS